MNTAALIVTLFLSNGVTCNGAPVATSSAATPRFNVSVCLASTEAICGITYAFERIDANGGTLRVNSRDQPPGGDVTDPAQVFPFVIPAPGAPQTHRDLGGTVDAVPIPPVTKLRLATYNITVLASKAATSYSLRLAPSSMAVLDPDGACGNRAIDRTQSGWQVAHWPAPVMAERPLTASFTVKKK